MPVFFAVINFINSSFAGANKFLNDESFVSSCRLVACPFRQQPLIIIKTDNWSEKILGYTNAFAFSQAPDYCDDYQEARIIFFT